MVDIDETTVLLVTFVILLVPYPLISVGTTGGSPALWWFGIALLVLGGLVPPISRYAFGESEENEEDADDENGGDEG